MRRKPHLHALTLCCILLLANVPRSPAGRAPLQPRKADPCLGAIVVNAGTGEVLIEENADAMGYPASMIKLMDLLLVLEQVEQGGATLEQDVRVDAESAGMGGSQVYLAENELFSVNELLYALMIQSANDAAVALAKRLAGSTDEFVKRMNSKAQELGMRRTRFHSVHGLPPGEGQSPDVSTARDIASLSRAVLAHPQALAYTSVTERGFRNDEFMMRTHNPLLRTFDGCDGLKTGYFRKGGFSIAATAERDGVRLVAVVLGSETKQRRNAKAAELLSSGFLQAGSNRRAVKSLLRND